MTNFLDKIYHKWYNFNNKIAKEVEKMNDRILQCLNEKHGNYMLPFLWLHGEEKERVYEEIIAIKNSGIKAFCAESRPYKDFCKENWWDDFEYILKTAKELDMEVWLLDDREFPTGYANGYLEDESRKDLLKKTIREKCIEVVGPAKNMKIWAEELLIPGGDEEIISVIAYRHTVGEALDGNTAVNLTETLHNGYVYFDVPEGVWRVCITILSSYPDRSSRMAYYVDMLNPQSCKAQIEAVYQPHYERFSEYFGNTFKGFFSDEPGFWTSAGTYYLTLGIPTSYYPWREDLPLLIAKSAGISVREAENLIPALWENVGEKTSLIRNHYMDVITKLYSENFCYTIGNWCRERGVMYIGHVIEDDNAHMRLGYGAGHFFRALDGQDMAGMDSVLFQHMPGVLDTPIRGATGDKGILETDFFWYTLPKMTASHAHIQPLKKGRAMCEIFGAYGWPEGITYMKHTADLMLSCGINHFVPHAFTAKDDDPDCPPHFYNSGKNVQYEYFKNLINYMGRVSHVLQGGTHKASVAVFYNAEAEWCGGKAKMFQEVCKTLTRGLIDFDIVPYDALCNAEVKDGKLLINKEEYQALIVSESEILPLLCIKCFERLNNEGLPVIFENALPVKSAENVDISKCIKGFETVKTEEIPGFLREKNIYDIKAEGKNIKYLRFYHVQKENENIYMFSNDAIKSDIDAEITLPFEGEFLVYEPWSNKVYRDELKDGKLHLFLEKGNALIIAFGGDVSKDLPKLLREKEKMPLNLKFDIWVKGRKDADFVEYAKNSTLFDISAPDKIADFCGQVKYVTRFNKQKDFSVFDLGETFEIAQVWCNGKDCGVRVNAPYKFNIGDFEGNAEIEVLVTSNTGHEPHNGLLNAMLPIPPTGILGDVFISKYE